MGNSKGIVDPVSLTIQILIGCTMLAAVWHIPAWSKAKAEGKTAEYQAQKMWPQQIFAKLPGGDSHKPNAIEESKGNEGNFKGGHSN